MATPYQLVATDPAQGPCHEANADQSAFVQATIISNGRLSVYSPVVVDRGTQPAAAPVVPRVPAGSTIGVWFGFQGAALTLKDSGTGSLTQGRCVSGLNGSAFGQFAHCNAPAFFATANNAIRAGTLTVPALGTARDGMACESTRDFALIDQDQSDNLTTKYLLTANGQIAQATTANMQKFGGAKTLTNASDNGLLDGFVDPALGCKPWTTTDLADGTQQPGMAMDELQAAAKQAAPSALVPLSDPMTLVNGRQSQQKTNMYRAGVDQPALNAGQTPQQYCQDMDNIQAARLQKDQAIFQNAPSPDAAAANNLANFLGSRLQQSFVNLKCGNFGLQNPVSNVQTDGNGVVTGVTFRQRR